MKHKTDKSDMIECLPFVRIYSFMKERNVHFTVHTVFALYIIVLFVKLENNNFVSETQHVLQAFIAWW